MIEGVAEVRKAKKEIEYSLEELLEVFNAFPDLFSCDAPGAKVLQDRLKVLIEREREEASRDDLRALFSWRLVLKCPEILEINGRPGFEWVADEFKKMLARQAIARNYGLVEAELYSTGRQKSGNQNRQRSDLTFQGLLRIASAKIGRPSELARDLQRAVLVQTYRRILGLGKTQVLRYIAGIEAVQKAGDKLNGKMIRINIGTDHRRKYMTFRYGKAFWKDNRSMQPPTKEKIFDAEYSTSKLRQIDGSLQNVKRRGFELVEITDMRDNKAEWHGAIIPVPRSYKTFLENSGLQSQLADKLQRRVEQGNTSMKGKS